MVERVTKSYGSTLALSDVSLRLGSGKVLALFGENGAGKSTLLGCLAGAIAPDTGEIYLDGQRYHPRGPRDALSSGVALVAQELLPCRELSVAENIVVGKWPRGGRFGTSRGSIMKRAQELADRFGVRLPLERMIAEVSVGEMQLVEILRVLNRSTRVVLLDEPTAALNATESELVLQLVQRLAIEGVTVVLVTHRVKEALSVASEVAVLRGSKLVYQSSAAAASPEIIVEQMLGRKLEPHVGQPKSTSGRNSVLRVGDWQKRGIEPLEGVSFSVDPGEIVGMYGVRGSGLGTLAGALAGVVRLDAGTTEVGAVRLKGSFGSPRVRESAGVHFVPSDRARSGLALSLATSTNLLFPQTSDKGGMFRRKAEELQAVSQLMQSYGVVGIPTQPVATLSGGNQQKVLLASRLLGSCRVVVVHEPTRGIDIGAREVIHNVLREVAGRDIGVLVISSDVDEIVELVDRALVLSHGRLSAELTGAEITVDQLLLRADARSNTVSSAQR
ncbi:MAG: sugar ABC transporter ATP-binding protein [Ferrimicrobium sp.]